MSRVKKLIIVGSALAALAAGGAAEAGAVGGGDDANEQATGPGADSAREAALRITSGGTANSVEHDGENGATWEVEVTKTDGKTVDVRLDEQYGLVVIEGDSDQSESGN
jgi:uncharacterized membrane protein YkoI